MCQINERLRAIRTARKLTQSQVAEAVGLQVKTYSTYECGTREPSAMLILKLALFYDISADYLLGREIKKSSAPETFGAELNADVVNSFKDLDDSQKKCAFAIIQKLARSDHEQRQLFVRMISAFDGLMPVQQSLFVQLLESLNA